MGLAVSVRALYSIAPLLKCARTIGLELCHGMARCISKGCLIMRAFIVAACVLLGASAFALNARAQLRGHEECGSLDNHIGPFNVRTQPELLANVEHHHFNRDVEQLKRGQSSYLIEDLEYVVFIFPNHYRALAAIARLSQKTRSEKIPGARYPTYCYFVRAIEFAPDDARVRVIYAVFLSQRGSAGDALAQLQFAENLGSDDADTFYNMGLLYLEQKNYDKAVEYAKRAYSRGIQLPGLRNKLRQAGKWTE